MEEYVPVEAMWKICSKPQSLMDRGFLCLLYMTGGRVSEVLALERRQFSMSKDRRFLMIENMHISKRRKGIQREAFRDVPLPWAGVLKRFSSCANQLVLYSPREGKIFPWGRVRAWRMVKAETGMWPHWFRAQAASRYGRLFRDPHMLKDFMGWSSSKSADPYVHRDWREYTKELLS